MSEYGHYQDRAIDALRRIAEAFEEQNRQNQAWIALQKQWHDEEEALMQQRYYEYLRAYQASRMRQEKAE